VSAGDALAALLAERFGDAFRDRRAELAREFRTEPPLRYGGWHAVRYLCLHHTAGPTTGYNATYEGIWNLHVKRMGWSGPGYGTFVYPDGRVDVGVGPERITWGVWGRYAEVYNVCTPGNYTRDTPSAVQLNAIYVVLCALDDLYGGAGRPWRGHRELTLPGHGTACPGALLKHLESMRRLGAVTPRPARYAA